MFIKKMNYYFLGFFSLSLIWSIPTLAGRFEDKGCHITIFEKNSGIIREDCKKFDRNGGGRNNCSQSMFAADCEKFDAKRRQAVAASAPPPPPARLSNGCFAGENSFDCDKRQRAEHANENRNNPSSAESSPSSGGATTDAEKLRECNMQARKECEASRSLLDRTMKTWSRSCVEPKVQSCVNGL
ncbi:MAG: hypothetical protein WC635_09315 [Bacteriovorax sp.]|jgi:hypothetical protein